MRNSKTLTTLTAACALVLWAGTGYAANLTTTKVQTANVGWNEAGIWQTNGTGPFVGPPVPGNTYELIPNGTEIGNNLNETRLRNPYASGTPSPVTFPGDSLTLNTNTEIRFKRVGSGNVPVCNFPGVGGNPGLILNGGMLNAGDADRFTVSGHILAAPGTESYICPGNNDGASVDAARCFTIAGKLSGSGTLAVIMAGTTNPQRITGVDNPYSGTWLVKAGVLEGTGSNSFGIASSFRMDPAYVLPVPPFSSTAPMTEVTGPAILEPMYDLNSAGTLTLVNGGQMRLHQNCAFTAVNIEGTPLTPGTHYYPELAAAYPNNFPAGGSGAITVQPYGSLPIIFTVQPPAQAVAYSGRTVQFTARAAGQGTITYQWRKNGLNLADGANVSGATTATLTLSNIGAAEQASYDVVASNGSQGATSTPANLTVLNPTNPYESGVLALNPAFYYRLNETGDPATGNTRVFDWAAGTVGTYGAGVQNGNAAYNVQGPGSTDGFNGLGAVNKAARFANGTGTSRITVAPWNLNTNTVTITAWVKPAGPQLPYNAIVFCRGSGTTAGLNYSPNVDASFSPTLGYHWNGEGETWRWDSGMVPPANQWSFVALAVSPTAATMYMVNANGQFQATHKYPHVLQSFAGTTLIGDDSNDGGNGARVFSGDIDEVAVFAAALSKSDVLSLYSAAGGTFPGAPAIIDQPDSLSLYRGQTARFRVVAGGAEPLTFQWKSGIAGSGVYTPLSDNARITGSSSAELTIANVTEADGGDYIVTVQNGSGTVNSTPAATLTVYPTVAPEIITLGVQQVGGANWDTPDWSDGMGATDSAAYKAGSTYELLGGSRMRTPETNRTSVFPGNLLKVKGDGVWVNNPASTVTNVSEIRFKQPNPGRVNFARLSMEGGQLDSGNDGIIELGGRIDILTNAPFYNDSGNDRGWYVDAWLTGSGTIEYRGYSQSVFMPNYVNNLNIAGTSNTFSGKWNIVLGTLLATAPNCLGTNDIAIGAQAAFEPTYDINNVSANLILNGRMYLHQNHTFRSVFVNGVPLNVGTFTFAELSAAYPNNFPAAWTPQRGATNFTTGSGSITVLVQPKPIITQEPADLQVYPTQTAQFTVQAQGTLPLGYRWRKGGAFITDGGNRWGTLTNTLTITNVAVADAGNYDVVVTNSIGSVTSRVAVLTLRPTGPAMNLTLDFGGAAVVQAQGADWNTVDQWSDGRPASVSALANPGSTYRVVPGARLRTPAGAAASVFPGETLIVEGDGVFAEGSTTASEIRIKHGNPGSVYFKHLVMNGGMLDSGDNGLVSIEGWMEVLANTPIFADSGAGQDRPWRIDALLTGNGSIEYQAYNNSFAANLNIAGTANTFSGKWNVVQGVLLGSAPNSLGTNEITIGANGALETLYDIANYDGALSLEGQMFLHQNSTFKAVTVAGTSLTPGTYTFAQLNGAYPANFPATWPLQIGSTVSTGSGSLTVLGDAPPVVRLQVQFNGSDMVLTWTQGSLMEANDVTGPWNPVSSGSPYTINPTQARKFYRVKVR